MGFVDDENSKDLVNWPTAPQGLFILPRNYTCGLDRGWSGFNDFIEKTKKLLRNDPICFFSTLGEEP